MGRHLTDADKADETWAEFGAAGDPGPDDQPDFSEEPAPPPELKRSLFDMMASVGMTITAEPS